MPSRVHGSSSPAASPATSTLPRESGESSARQRVKWPEEVLGSKPARPSREGPAVRDGRTMLLDARDGRTGTHLGAGLLGRLDETRVELGPVDQPEEHLTGPTGTCKAPIEAEGDRVHPVAQRELEARRKRV